MIRVDEADKATSRILDRQPPCSIEAEQAVLGSILLLPEVCDEVALIVRPSDFYDDANMRIYEHVLAMHDSGKRIDPMLLVESLKAADIYDVVGGASYLAELGNCVPTAAHAEYYAEIVKRKSMLRSLILAGTDIIRDAYDPTVDARHLLGRAEEKVFAIQESRGTGDLASIREVLDDSLKRIDARMQHDHARGGLETGFDDYDDLTGGLHNSELIILAARPSMGKTALAMNIAEHVSVRCHKTVLFVSLEMSAIELGDRLLCSAARVNSKRLRNGTITNAERELLVQTAAEISQAPLFVDDTPTRNMTEIAATARRLKRREDLALVVIDYLQLIEPDNPKDPRQEQVSRIARRLKGMSRELEIPVMCLAQLNRQAEVTKDNRPRLSHLRESGAIEQDADVVMFVHREEYYQTNEQARAEVAGKAELIVQKQRNGPIGDVPLAWLHEFTRFENYAHRPYDELESFGGEY